MYEERLAVCERRKEAPLLLALLALSTWSFPNLDKDRLHQHAEFSIRLQETRKMLKTISEAVFYLARQELAFRDHGESSASLNTGNYRELLECIAKFDSIFERRLHGRLANSERANAGNDLIECIELVIQDQIYQEIKDCTFLSIQVDGTTGVSTKEQLSVIVRLDRNGEIIERFLKFYNVS